MEEASFGTLEQDCEARVFSSKPGKENVDGFATWLLVIAIFIGTFLIFDATVSELPVELEEASLGEWLRALQAP